MRSIFFVLALLVATGPAFAQDPNRDDIPSALESLYKSLDGKVGSVVVSIRVDRDGEKKPTKKKRPSFGSPVRDGGVFQYRPADAPVTGTIMSENGHILTTWFNLRDGGDSIRVTLPDGRVLPATVKGFNATYDLALLQVEAKGLPVLPRAPLNRIRTGQMVVACGRDPDQKNLTLNPGIVSAPWRMSGRGIQIDSLMNYGNVGGPVVTRSGKMVGISCRVDTKYAGSTGQNSGIGFVVTWDKIDSVLPDLRTGKNVKEIRKPFLGIQANTESEVKGVEISEVVPASAAEKAGIQPGDVIIEFDGKKVNNFDMLRDAIVSKVPGDALTVVLRRGEKTLTLEVVLGWAPGE